MFKSLFVGVALLFSLSAFADDGHTHTQNVCAAKNPAVCAHLGIYGTLNSTDAAKFIVDVMTPDGAAYTNLKVVLWMPDMGHGSRPVTLQDMGHNHSLVTDAYFIMAGAWLVKLNFDYAGQNLDIDIPVDVAQ